MKTTRSKRKVEFGGTGRVTVHAVDAGGSTAVVEQVGGTHYSSCSGLCPHCGGEIQHWDLYARAPYLEAQVSRYIIRWQQKGKREDLLKARSFLDKLLKVLDLAKSTAPPDGDTPAR